MSDLHHLCISPPKREYPETRDHLSVDHVKFCTATQCTLIEQMHGKLKWVITAKNKNEGQIPVLFSLKVDIICYLGMYKCW